MHASRVLSATAPDEERKKVYFNDYFEAFLDAKEQKKYAACLDSGPHGKDFPQRYSDAQSWLKTSRAETEKYRAFFPPEKQITDVEEIFADINAKRASRRVVVTLRDGTRTVSESQFDKTAH